MTETHPLICRRPGCGHRYSGVHAPGGGNCMWWDPVTGERCDCPGFRYVELSGPVTPGDAEVPRGNRRFR